MDSTDRIRILIDSFYSGSASNEDMQELLQLFRHTPSLPADMQVDKDVIMALHGEHKVEVPVRLTRSAAMIGVDSRVKSILRWTASIAAAAVLVAGGVWAIDYLRSSHVEAGTELVVAEQDSTESLEPVQYNDGEMTDASREVSEDAEDTTVASSSMRRVRNRLQPRKTEKLTPAQQKAAYKSIEMLNKALSKMELAYADVESSFEDVERNINSIEK